MARVAVEPGVCGAVQVQETLFETYLHVCRRGPHPLDFLHYGDGEAFKGHEGERHLMDYTCNNIHKEKGRTFFCELQLSHAGDHRDGERTWPQDVYDDEDSPRVW